MRYLPLLAALTLSSPASALTMSIGYELPFNGPGIALAAQAVNPINGTLATSFSVSNWNVSVNFIAGSTTDLTGVVSVTAIDPTKKDWISVYLSLSDITAPVGPVNVKNTMTVNMPTGWWLDRTAYIDDAAQQDGGNGIFSLTTYLQPPLIFDHGGTEVYNTPYNVPPGLYSLTQFYSVQNTPVAVPGPVVGAGVPGLVALLLGAWFKRRRT